MMKNLNFANLIETLQQRCEQQLIAILPQSIDGTENTAFEHTQTLCQAMSYSTLNGGKRIRPLLTYATGIAFAAPIETLDLAACAVELIHSGSLIHDDLPAMDDDELRRGKPTCHIAFDEATAILAGDGLQCYAYEILAQQIEYLSAEQIVKMVEILAHANGSQGITGGQSLDIIADNLTLTEKDVATIHHLKTGTLMSAAIKLGVIAANVTDPSIIENVHYFADCIGLAFQIVDDILDIESCTDILGKPVGSDQNKGKLTYPAVIGLAESKRQAKQLHQKAMAYLQNFDEQFDFLRYIASYIINRVH